MQIEDARVSDFERHWQAMLACIARGRRERGVPLTQEEMLALRRDSEIESQRIKQLPS